jgi:hypothetical protein
MSGGLLHLFSIDNNHRMSATADNQATAAEAFDIKDYEFTNNQVLLPRNHDIIMPKYLLINLPEPVIHDPNLRENYIGNLLENWSFNLQVGPTDVLSIPFLVMNALESYSITPNNKFKLTIPFEKVFSFSNGIPIVSLQFHNIHIILQQNQPTTGNNQGNIANIISGKLICISKYLNPNERRIMASNNHNAHIKEIHPLNLESQTANKRFEIDGFGLLNGIIFQITTPNTTLENIRKISILLNDHTRLEWDADILNLIAYRLSPKSFYINPNMNGVVGLLSPIDTNTLNLSIFDRFAISIETNLETGFNISARFIVNNKIVIRGGMMAKEILGNFIDSINRPVATPRNVSVPHYTSNTITWNARPLDFDVPADLMCPILYEPINLVNDGVYKCITCSNLIGFNAFRRWIEESTSQHCCPLCRTRDIVHIYYKSNGHNNNPSNHTNVINEPLYEETETEAENIIGDLRTMRHSLSSSTMVRQISNNNHRPSTRYCVIM